MAAGFRASMNWLHTWAGVVLGGLLFAIFWMGTLSVFDREIDRWMAPATRLALPGTPASLELVRPALDRAAAARSPFFSVLLPTDRQPTIRVLWREGQETVQHQLDPATGAAVADPGTLAGTGFLFPFHHMLHVKAARLGMWLVGAAGMAMLALCVTGVVIHRRIFADFFTLRAGGKSGRLVLDLHNAAGALGFPFHVAITLSGLIFLYMTYFPSGMTVVYRDDPRGFAREAFGDYARPRLGTPAPAIRLDAAVAGAERLWGAPPRSLVVRHPGDAAAYVQVSRPGEDRVSAVADLAYFDAATGALLHQRIVDAPMLSAQRFISGLHLVQFRHWTLRWLYFGLGLTGCLLIATGYLFWLESRRKRHAQLGLSGVRIVEGLAVGSIGGILIATLAFFAVNRLLPIGASFAGQDRASLEVWTFYLVWLGAFAHAWLRPGRAWIEQCGTITMLAAAAVLLNWLTTGDQLLRSLSHRHLWPVAGMDLLLLAAAAAAALAAGRLRHRDAARSGPMRAEPVKDHRSRSS